MMIKNLPLYFLFALTLAFLTACGGDKTVDAALTEKEIAIEKIKLYADDQSKPEPSVQDYIDAGLTGIDDSNLSDINNLVGTLTPEDVDTTEELIELTDQLGINNQPIVNAGENITLEAGQSVRITGTATDIDGSIASYKWEESGNTLATSAFFEYSSTTVGPHILVFTATD